MSDYTIPAFTKGCQNMLNAEIIASDAAQDSLGWLTKEGRIVLSYGRNLYGNDSATAGSIQGLWFGYKNDGTKVCYRKSGTKIQYLKSGTWTDIITGLTDNADYSFANYSSSAGSFTYVGGVDGLWKIINANPENPISLTPAGGVFKGRIMIDKARMFLWNKKENPAAIYYSQVDAQKVGTQYTDVSGEAVNTSGTLAFKAGGSTRSCFFVSITITAGGEVYTDNGLGVLKGSLGGADGTINYATGAYTVRASGTAAYKWEDSNSKGITDFSFSATRVAGEGNILSQSEGGDAILNVLIGQDGEYYSAKAQSFYKLTLDSTDLVPVNIVYRKDLGIPSFRACISTNKGIVFMNTANPLKPEMTILEKSIVTNNVEPVILFPHFKFANYDYSDCSMDTWERYVIIFCKKQLSFSNDTVLLCDLVAGTVDPIQYSGRCSAKDNGNLYVGHPLVQNVYQLFNGFDDDGVGITNFWIGKKDPYKGQIAERLKKYRKQKVKGMIGLNQKIEAYVDCDGSGFQLIGTILGTGDYVDYTSPQSMGNSMVGQSQIGGDDSATVAYPFFTELKVKLPYFKTRTIKFIATGIGYASVDFLSDWDIIPGVQRLPSRFRQKQNVSLDGLSNNITQN
jgi:hypothetical protein